MQKARPIALLCVGYKLLERVIYNRISAVVDETINIEQAGFRPNRNCCDQVLSLVTHIEAGFQDKKQTAVAFIDLSSAYDTVWKTGLLFKLSKVVKCRKTVDLISEMLSNRQYIVYLGNSISRKRTLNNGLPQGSVLAPILFNLYTSDIPNTKSRKFIYADDMALAIQYTYSDKSSITAISNLSDDLKILEKYYNNWRLKPNPEKTEVSSFHLSNSNADAELEIKFCDKLITHNKKPKYLGVILDRSLTFKDTCVKIGEKLKSRNNIIQKLTGVAWGTSAQTLRISSLALVFSAAEYCAPVWSHSAHVHYIDTQLNSTMRMITGNLKSTPLPWLPILSNIEPSVFRREAALAKEIRKICNNIHLPIHKDLQNRKGEANRLQSRSPLWTKMEKINYNDYSIHEKWKCMFESLGQIPHMNLISEPYDKVEGFHIPRRLWVTLNRIRSNHGRTQDMLHKWDSTIPPNCDCGHPL